jgi:hypothetical protein
VKIAESVIGPLPAGAGRWHAARAENDRADRDPRAPPSPAGPRAIRQHADGRIDQGVPQPRKQKDRADRREIEAEDRGIERRDIRGERASTAASGMLIAAKRKSRVIPGACALPVWPVR